MRSYSWLNVTLPEIHNATIILGDGHFVGDITNLNLWSVDFTWSEIVMLALNPGNAPGDLFSWKNLKEQAYAGTLKTIEPSTSHQRSGNSNSNNNNLFYHHIKYSTAGMFVRIRVLNFCIN